MKIDDYHAMRRTDVIDQKIDGAAHRLVENGFDYDDAVDRIIRAIPLSRARDVNRSGCGIDVIISRSDDKAGVVLNHRSRKCQLSGCNGWRMHVRWDDGVTTYPCTKGVNFTSSDCSLAKIV